VDDRRPNIVFMMADDHPAHASSAYGSRIDRTPSMERLAAEGMRLDAGCCTKQSRPLLAGAPPADWRTSMYGRYWVHHDVAHHVWEHYGVRTARYKLVYYYAEPCDTPGAYLEPRVPEWEPFDLAVDPRELRSVYDDPSYAAVVRELKAELRRLQQELGDTECPPGPD
jgi:arylsulfatase A-like enzyme